MLDLFKKYIDQNKLIQPNEEVLLAISGGIDSIVMLDLFHRAGIKYAIAHCNFKLRLFESDDDELFVRDLAHKYNVEVFIGLCQASDYSKMKGLSIQEAARNLRYDWFNKVCLYNNYTSIAIAHNHDDVIETYFINLFRGAGIKGLKSIPVKRNNVIRPILFATRKQIEEYVKQHNLKYREDSSNKSDNYLRNKIRHHLIPKLNEISPEASTSIKKTIDNLRDSDLLLQSVINEKKQKLFITQPNDTLQLSISKLLQLKPLKSWAFHLLGFDFGFNRKTTDAICDTIISENYTGHRFNSADYELLVDRKNMLIRKIDKSETSQEYQISNKQKEINQPLCIKFRNHKYTPDFKISNNKNIAYFDSSKLTYPLTIRKWQHGDRMKPFGMNGNKLISDILINNKIDSFKKENIHVILSGEKIIWLVGYRSSNEFRITKSTVNITVMELSLQNSDKYHNI